MNISTAFECRSIPLVDLELGDCKWPVNEAEPGRVAPVLRAAGRWLVFAAVIASRASIEQL